MEDRKAIMEGVLASPTQQAAFVEFCKKNHCAENILFYRAIAHFEAADDDAARLAQARLILGQFIKPQSPLEVNMPDTQRAALSAQLVAGDIAVTVFAELKAAAFKDMMRDTLPRFMKDPMYAAATSAASVELVHVSRQYQDVAKRLRKRKVLGFKVKQRHSKSDLKAFAELGDVMRRTARKEGFLHKRGDNHQTWKRRWCVLAPVGLAYFLDEYRFAPKGVVLAHEIMSVNADMDVDIGMRFTLGIVTELRTYVIQASSDRDRKRWVAALRDFIAKPAMQAPRSAASGAGPGAGAGSA